VLGWSDRFLKHGERRAQRVARRSTAAAAAAALQSRAARCAAACARARPARWWLAPGTRRRLRCAGGRRAGRFLGRRASAAWRAARASPGAAATGPCSPPRRPAARALPAARARRVAAGRKAQTEEEVRGESPVACALPRAVSTAPRSTMAKAARFDAAQAKVEPTRARAGAAGAAEAPAGPAQAELPPRPALAVRRPALAAAVAAAAAAKLLAADPRRKISRATLQMRPSARVWRWCRLPAQPRATGRRRLSILPQPTFEQRQTCYGCADFVRRRGILRGSLCSALKRVSAREKCVRASKMSVT